MPLAGIHSLLLFTPLSMRPHASLLRGITRPMTRTLATLHAAALSRIYDAILRRYSYVVGRTRRAPPLLNRGLAYSCLYRFLFAGFVPHLVTRCNRLRASTIAAALTLYAAAHAFRIKTNRWPSSSYSVQFVSIPVDGGTPWCRIRVTRTRTKPTNAHVTRDCCGCTPCLVRLRRGHHNSGTKLARRNAPRTRIFLAAPTRACRAAMWDIFTYRALRGAHARHIHHPYKASWIALPAYTRGILPSTATSFTLRSRIRTGNVLLAAFYAMAYGYNTPRTRTQRIAIPFARKRHTLRFALPLPFAARTVTGVPLSRRALHVVSLCRRTHGAVYAHRGRAPRRARALLSFPPRRRRTRRNAAQRVSAT